MVRVELTPPAGLAAGAPYFEAGAAVPFAGTGLGPGARCAMDVDFCAVPAAPGGLFAPAEGSAFCAAAGFCGPELGGFTAVFFGALDTGPSADIDLLTVSP